MTSRRQQNGKRNFVADVVQVVAVPHRNPFHWKSLLPSARGKLVADGLFTSHGDITDLGKSALAAIEAKQNP